jgi:hypothetical protein
MMPSEVLLDTNDRQDVCKYMREITERTLLADKITVTGSVRAGVVDDVLVRMCVLSQTIR